MSAELHAIAEYLAFVQRRARFIAGGCGLCVAVMAVVSWSMTPTYAAWAVVDAGTLGRERPSEMDKYRNHFNASVQQSIVARLGGDRLSRVYLFSAPPVAMIRAYAVDGATAAAAANEGAQIAVDALATLALPAGSPPPAATDPVIIALRHDIGPTVLKVDQAMAAARAAATQAHHGAADALEKGAKTGEVAAHLRSGNAFARHAAVLEEWHRQLRRALSTTVPERAVAALGRAHEVDLTSIDTVERAASELRELLSDIVTTYQPPRITATPDVPESPSWPNHAMNLLIAFVFGLVASVFSALIFERDPRPVEVQHT